MNKPMGVSQWREYGKKYGYWNFFVERFRKIGEEEAYNKGFVAGVRKERWWNKKDKEEANKESEG